MRYFKELNGNEGTIVLVRMQDNVGITVLLIVNV